MGVYLVLFFISSSFFSVLLLRHVPVTVTPYKVYRMVGNLQEYGLKIKSKWTRIDDISPLMVVAVVSTEDGKFMQHRGFDLDEIKKTRKERKSGKRFRGASTISQQTAKNVFCTPHRNWFRKGLEAYFTVLIETFWDKKRIMEIYLNVIEIRPCVYGVGSAAKLVYAKQASELNSYEASMIATVLPNPYTMNIEKPSRYMVNRAANVRSLMNKTGKIDLGNKKNNKNNDKLR